MSRKVSNHLTHHPLDPNPEGEWIRHPFCQQPPIQVFGVEGRYVTALYSAASKSKNLDVVEKDIKLVRAQLSKDKPFEEFCRNPSIKRSEKATQMGLALDKLKLNQLTKNTLTTMAENGRLVYIGAFLSKFEEVMSAHHGEILCVVRTAKPVDKTTEKELRDALQQFLKPGEKLHLTLETDPSLIGGMVVTIGDRYVDMSIAQKIRTYRQAMEQPV